MKELSLHILDILQNSLAAGATHIETDIWEDPERDILTVVIRDNGRGMPPEEVARLGDPFFTSRTTRRVGMGIPLYMQSAQRSGGKVEITSHPGVGTTVTATFGLSHIDRPPVGDIAGTFILAVAANPDREFVLRYRYGSSEYVFDTREVREALGPIPLSDPQITAPLTEIVETNIAELKC